MTNENPSGDDTLHETSVDTVDQLVKALQRFNKLSIEKQAEIIDKAFAPDTSKETAIQNLTEAIKEKSEELAEMAKYKEARLAATERVKALSSKTNKVKAKEIKKVTKTAGFGETTQEISTEREVTNDPSKEAVKARLDSELNTPEYVMKLTDGKKKELTEAERADISKLRDELSGLFSVGAKKDHLSELDQYIEGAETDENAQRNNDSGHDGVRIKFTGKPKNE